MGQTNRNIAEGEDQNKINNKLQKRHLKDEISEFLNIGLILKSTNNSANPTTTTTSEQNPLVL